MRIRIDRGSGGMESTKVPDPLTSLGRLSMRLRGPVRVPTPLYQSGYDKPVRGVGELWRRSRRSRLYRLTLPNHPTLALLHATAKHRVRPPATSLRWNTASLRTPGKHSVSTATRVAIACQLMSQTSAHSCRAHPWLDTNSDTNWARKHATAGEQTCCV
jgi:hypothetical protein